MLSGRHGPPRNSRRVDRGVRCGPRPGVGLSNPVWGGRAASPTASLVLVDGVEVVRQCGPSEAATMSIAPRIGHNTHGIGVHRKSAFWFPVRVGQRVRCSLCPVLEPLLAPWANRSNADTFHAGGRQYRRIATISRAMACCCTRLNGRSPRCTPTRMRPRSRSALRSVVTRYG